MVQVTRRQRVLRATAQGLGVPYWRAALMLWWAGVRAWWERR